MGPFGSGVVAGQAERRVLVGAGCVRHVVAGGPDVARTGGGQGGVAVVIGAHHGCGLHRPADTAAGRLAVGDRFLARRRGRRRRVVGRRLDDVGGPGRGTDWLEQPGQRLHLAGVAVLAMSRWACSMSTRPMCRPGNVTERTSRDDAFRLVVSAAAPSSPGTLRPAGAVSRHADSASSYFRISSPEHSGTAVPSVLAWMMTASTRGPGPDGRVGAETHRMSAIPAENKHPEAQPAQPSTHQLTQDLGGVGRPGA